MKTTKLVYVEFVGCYPGDGNCYFVGKDLKSVLADTDGGKGFGGREFASHRKITEDEARDLKLDFIASGIEAVKAGKCRSYKLRAPAKGSPSASCGTTESGIGRNWYPMNPAIFTGLR